MWTWINENSGALSAAISLGTMIVWIAYFQILYRQFSRQRRTKIMINRGAGYGIDSRCLISNMGAEPLYVVSIVAALQEGSTRITSSITDLDSSEISSIEHASEGTNQGPMMSGAFLDIGPFSKLMARCARANQESADNLESRFDSFEVTIIAAYGAKDLFVGASRSFTLSGEYKDKRLDPTSISTRQHRSRRERRQLEAYLHDRI